MLVADELRFGGWRLVAAAGLAQAFQCAVVWMGWRWRCGNVGAVNAADTCRRGQRAAG